MNEQIKGSTIKAPDLVEAIRRAARQEQFLNVALKHIGADERLIIDVARLFALQHCQHGSGR